MKIVIDTEKFEGNLGVVVRSDGTHENVWVDVWDRDTDKCIASCPGDCGTFESRMPYGVEVQ